MSVRINSRSRATPQVKSTPAKPSYDSEDEESDGSTSRYDEEDKEKRQSARSTNHRHDEDIDGSDEYENALDSTRNNQEDKNNESDREDEQDKKLYQNGISEETKKLIDETDELLSLDKDVGSTRSIFEKAAKEPPPVAHKPRPPVVPPLGPNKEKSWPPPAPKKYDAFAVEGHGRMNPYTKELIPDKEHEPEPEPEPETTIDDTSTKPVNELKKNWQGKTSAPSLGVQKPRIAVQGETTWIKHVKPPVEYEEPPKEPDWLKLVRNRRWNSTVKARFPCKNADVVDFERRSTTPKNWKRLLLDKKAVRTIGEITGIGAEGEELLWRLAKQRGKIGEGTEQPTELPVPGEQDLLAYEHIKENLEAAVVDAAIQAGIDPNDYPEDGQSVVSEDSEEKGNKNGRKPSSSSNITTASLRQRLLRLHPEEFKKLLALDRARDAHLRWQFSTDPYDSVHEHQLQPFEVALLAGEKDNRLRYLLKKLLKLEDMPPSATSSGRSTPVFGKPRARSLSASQYTSDQESDSGSSVSSARRSRAKKKPPAPLPRKGRSVSPSLRDRQDEIVHGFLGPDDEQLKSELQKLEQMSQGIGLSPEISDLLNQASGRSDEKGYKKERPEEAITMGLGDRMRSFMENKPAKADEQKEQPLDSITRSLSDRKTSFLDEAQRAATHKKEQSDVDEVEGGRVSDIDTDEISSRRRRFLDQEKQAKSKRNLPEKEKARHKVQRIKSDAELYAVLSKRRMATDEEDAATDEPPSAHSEEMKGLLDDITKTFGGQQYTRIGKRKPRFQKSDDSDTNQISEGAVEDDAEEEEEEEAPARRPNRRKESNGRKKNTRRTQNWSDSEEDSDDERDEAR